MTAGPWMLEIAGLPGAGKSTLATALANALAAHGAEIVPLGPGRRRALSDTRLARLGHTLRLAARHPALAISAQRLAEPSRLGLGRVRALLERLVFFDQLGALSAGADRAPLVLLDEGLVQGVMSLALEAPPHRAARAPRLLRTLLRGRRYAVLHIAGELDAAAATVASRRESRGRLDGLPPEIARARLERAPAIFHALLAEVTTPPIEPPTTEGALAWIHTQLGPAWGLRGLRVLTTAQRP